VGPLVITLGHSGNNPGALLKHMWGPPYKNRAIQQAFGRRIFRNFNRVAFLEICQALKACGAISPFNTKVPTFGCFPHFIVTSMLDIHICRSNGMAISFVVNDASHEVELPALNITLGIHILSNHIGRVFVTAAIRELNFIIP
jgi:hypothetical protein